MTTYEQATYALSEEMQSLVYEPYRVCRRLFYLS